ncbi:hypothetical protein N7471_001092 [Penicillium samsonianum]|uniref:uncharacterized protein n=1 Tax=Penicillium samsonianum TaxID=1882272 RepID=UPI002546D176|nr:uncharacterized protein N7471_001092 [Penicillium samsonianum]KAJ6149893.1 hypothetical protein N7471_001092 [Penicillium samsonianum]
MVSTHSVYTIYWCQSRKNVDNHVECPPPSRPSPSNRQRLGPHTIRFLQLQKFPFMSLSAMLIFKLAKKKATLEEVA